MRYCVFCLKVVSHCQLNDSALLLYKAFESGVSYFLIQVAPRLVESTPKLGAPTVAIRSESESVNPSAKQELYSSQFIN